MARRYSNDPRFEKQSQSLITFLTATACDPHQTDFLTPIERSGTVERITETFKEHEAESAPPPEPTEFSFDPDNFDDAINGSEPAQKTPRISEAHTSNVAFILGVFTFISATFAWGWMRLGIVKRRRIRYPCVLPTLLFDGIELVQAEARDISQLGMKLDCSHAFTPNQRIKVTIGPVETVAKIAWQNNHFIGVGFEQAISEIDMNHILGPYATDVANNAQEPRPAPIHDMPEFNEVDV